ncbi:MAG: HAMP domain-containing sensor histidine kinase [Vicinamibacterales bacterium]
MSRGRTFRLAVAMTFAVAVPIAVLLSFQYRSLSDLEHTSLQVLETLSSQTADGLVNTFQSDFRSPRFELAEVDDDAVQRLDLAKVGAVLAGLGRAPVHVESFYVWSRVSGGPFDNRVLEFETRPSDMAADPVERFRPAGAEAETLLGLAEDMVRRRLTIGIETTTINGRPHVVVVKPRTDNMPADPGRRPNDSPIPERLLAFAGYSIDLDKLYNVYLPGAVSSVLDKANTRAIAPLVVTVLNEEGRVVYQSAQVNPGSFVDERTVRLLFFDPSALGLLRTGPWRDRGPSTWTIRTGYGNQSIASIAHASTASHRWQLGLLLVLTAAGLFLGARSLVHEVHLAEMKSNFVASISHELKTPLALIQLFAETLELGRVKTADRAREYYTIIHTEARKLAGLIDNILDLSRLESGVRPFQFEPVDIQDVVRETLRDFENQIAHSGASVTSRFHGRPLMVSADSEAVQVALRNLLSNAIKYSPQHKNVFVEVAREQSQALVRVADQGLGIPRRQRRRIFQKFYRIEGGPDQPTGTGLGLAIVDQVMRAHGGRVEVVSEPGRGSTFTLSFPMAKEQLRLHETDSRDRGRAPDAAGVA